MIYEFLIVVAPFTGAWIEISDKSSTDNASKVAPFTGAWIEIILDDKAQCFNTVAPFTGAWIEILLRTACSPR